MNNLEILANALEYMEQHLEEDIRAGLSDPSKNDEGGEAPGGMS